MSICFVFCLVSFLVGIKDSFRFIFFGLLFYYAIYLLFFSMLLVILCNVFERIKKFFTAKIVLISFSIFYCVASYLLKTCGTSNDAILFLVPVSSILLSAAIYYSLIIKPNS